MSTGLYPDMELIERFVASPTAQTVSQRFVAPLDLDIVGMALYVSAAPGSTDGVIVNISNTPTSQLASVSAYNLWTTANAPTISGTATSNLVVANTTVTKNIPYALNYPLPGPTGTAGYNTAQSTALSTETPVTSPPTMIVLGVSGLIVPDNTYTDINGVTGQPASYVHAGDVLSFVITAGGSSVSIGSAVNLEINLFAQKH